MKISVLKEKSLLFAIRMVILTRYLQTEEKEFILSREVLQSGTAIGMLIREVEFAETSHEFTHKMQMALKEANKTEYWLTILYDTHYIEKDLFECLQNKCRELAGKLIESIRIRKFSKSGK